MRGLSIGKEHPCFIIAEIGQNHQGDLSLAKELITLAKECGADCVKFQKSSLPDKFTKDALDAPYESPNAFGKTYGDHKKYLEFSLEQYRELKYYAETQMNIMFTASAMDKVSADLLMDLEVPFIKIGSGDTNNFPMLHQIASKKKPIVLSTGMQHLQTVRDAVEIIRSYNCDLALLHCVSAYPTPVEDVKLSLINWFSMEFPDIPIGYSGHELGIEISIAAVALGAKIIERHFTKDKTLKGTDHQCSLDPVEFSALVKGIRNVEKAIGNPVKAMMPTEQPCKDKLGKSIVAADEIVKGSSIKLDDLSIKVSRPVGIPPERIYEIVGKVVKRTIALDMPLTQDDLY